MKVQQVDSSPERMILVEMITSIPVLAGIASKWDGKLFASSWANKIGGWCVEHFKRYQDAPGHFISGYFQDWALSANGDREAVELISSFLTYLSDEHSKSQKNHAPDYVLDCASKHFTVNRIKMLNRAAEADLEMNRVEQAAKRLIDFRKIEMGSSGFDTFASESLICELFAARAKPLIEFKCKAFNNFFDSFLVRDSFIAFWGKNKIGKSFFLLSLAWHAYTQGLNTAYFVVGDMSRLQAWPRLIERAARRPMRHDPHGWDFPIAVENIGQTMPRVQYEKRHSDKDMTQDDCLELFGRVRERFGLGLRVKTWPSLSVSVHGLESELESWAYDGYQVDAIIIDHTDNLAPIDKKEDSRQQIEATWKSLRALSQKWHALVVTATQTNAKSFHARLLTRDHFADNRCKLDDVLATIGINQTEEEKLANLYRLNFVNGRNLRFSESECLWLANCLPVADPMVLGTF